jgi:hypothetical protein
MSKMKIAALIVLLSGNVAATGVPSVFRADGCPAGLRETLERGGFSGEVFCDKQHGQFSLIGVTATSAAKYTIYDYRYRFLPENGNVWHAGQRMIIIRNNEYFGQFILSPPPDTTIELNGTKLTLSKPDVEVASVDLVNGVPSEIFFDGDVMHLQR